MVLDERQASAAAEQFTPSPEPMSDDGRRELEREVAYLRTFSDVYRTHLKTYLEALLRNAEDRGPSEQDSLPSTPAPMPRSR